MVRIRGWLGLPLLLAVGCTACARAEEVDELARIHTEAIGGRARLAKIEALRARGRVVAAGQTLEFELIAQRPNRVRVAMRAGARELVQIADGSGCAWRIEPDEVTGAEKTVTMVPADAREFTADAEFDDPLASLPERGYQLDSAGETEWEGRRVWRVLLTRNDVAPSYLLVDPETYFILARIRQRRLPSGREVAEDTIYGDFRPVAGVIFPFRVQTRVDGRLTRETVLLNVEPIPPPPAGTFTVPAGLATQGR